MTTVTLKTIARVYANNGQHAEQVARFTLTGEICKADNKPFTASGDCGDIQIKSARATICHGTDLNAHFELDGANRYGYVTADFSVMYIMSRSEYAEFVAIFGTVTRDSQKNGGAEKIRLKPENEKMRQWLTAKAA